MTKAKSISRALPLPTGKTARSSLETSAFLVATLIPQVSLALPPAPGVWRAAKAKLRMVPKVVSSARKARYGTNGATHQIRAKVLIRRCCVCLCESQKESAMWRSAKLGTSPPGSAGCNQLQISPLGSVGHLQCPHNKVEQYEELGMVM